MAVRYIIQARMFSTRLPGKILMQIGNKTLIQHIIDRLFLSGADRSEICFALGEEGANELSEYLDNQNILWITGDTHDVLSRYIKASQDMSIKDTIVRLTADNPFIDFLCLKDNVKIFQGEIDTDLSYPFKLPLGMGYEMFSRGALIKQLDYDLKSHHTEHVTTFIKENKNIFKVKPVNYYLNMPDIRLTIDYEQDLMQARKMYDYFKDRDLSEFCSDDVYNLYKINSDFFSINRAMRQKDARE
jgi:spore coat polysaccharide biosynthesis protein SpsF